MNSYLHRRQSGDTIVEVLIAISVVSLILVGAFLVSNNSTRAVQDDQEHSQAQQQLQSAVEAVRTTVAGGYTLSPEDTELCVNKNVTQPDKYTAASNPTNCQTVTIGGTTAIPTVKRVDGTYTFDINWASVQGGQAHEEIIYRYYGTTT